MKIDIDYIAKILNVFIESDKAYIDISDFQNSGINLDNESNPNGINEKFIFHIEILIDNKLINNDSNSAVSLKDLGIHIFHGTCSVSHKPIRLTQMGHDFSNALNKSDILETLKTNLKDAPFKTIFDGSQKLLEHALKKQLDKIIAE
ncbi:DUF2513 domain-containing protein [Parendozoicomonas haliclonae]|uniref:DUF2513 domain-containing protein n=1 Tax=Parendozoicomonas haliclonae TaxID=1960125 RepID=A0A1X7ASA1_9GAMM|nr:DUF2513 domain-containing protein [Parendozoicomonas haliclonae]SMA50978.1 hypothetical protein EHSB41UT_04801 [Parendozoicomonas haliclonae]